MNPQAEILAVLDHGRGLYSVASSAEREKAEQLLVAESATLVALQRAHTWAGPGLVASMLLAILGVVLAMAQEMTAGLALLALGFAAAWPSGIFAWTACRDAAEGAVGILLCPRPPGLMATDSEPV